MQKGSFPVVAIGASAGGLEAYKEFFHALPSETGIAFVLIQHLDPSHESMLTEIIAKTTTMSVEEVKSGTPIRPNHVYVIPPNALMALAGGAFQLSPRGRTPGQQLAVNFFMHSLAQVRKSGAIAIVLSGTGSDGTAGVEDIKAEGGITFAPGPRHGQIRWDAAQRHRFRVCGLRSCAKGHGEGVAAHPASSLCPPGKAR